MKLSKEEFAEKFVFLFPEMKQSLDEHYSDYNELLGHIYFAEVLNVPLIKMITEKFDDSVISKYCAFIEDMWQNGDDDVVNIVDVTILERLSDDTAVWKSFGKHISNDFIRYINTEVLVENAMMWQVSRLEYNK
jgi:hypothetical protein